MSHIQWDAELRAARNAHLLAAHAELECRTRAIEVEYSETVTKLRERYEGDLAEASAQRIAQVAPAQRAYNAAVIAAEQGRW